MGRYRTTMKDLLEKVYKEDGHQDVSSSKRMCRTIVEDAQQIESKLNTMSPEDSLDTWWTNKLAVSANNLNKARDYIVNDVQEAKMVSDISGISITALRKEARKFNIKVDRVTPGGPFGAEYEVTFDGSEQNLIRYAKEHLGFDDKPGTFSQLKKHLAMEEKDIEEISDKLKLKVLGRKIAKLKDKFLKKAIPGTGAMFAQKEEVELDEGKMKTIATMFDQGKSAEEIAKALKLSTSTVKQILGEDVKEEVMVEFSDAMLDKLAREYKPLQGKTISIDQANKLRKIFDRIPDRALDALRRKKIPFLSGLALSRMVQKGMPVKEETIEEQTMRQKAVMIAKKMAGNMTDAVKEIEKLMKGLSKDPVVATTLKRVNEDFLKEIDITKDNVKKGDSEKEKELKIKLDKEKDQDALEKQLIAAQGQINILKQKLENEKNKALKPEPNRETGEVPLTVGVAYKHFKDKEKKEIKKEDLEEDYVVKYQHYNRSGPMNAAAYKNKKDAEKFRDTVLKQGGKAILLTRAQFGGQTLKNSVEEAFAVQITKKEDLDEATRNTDFKVKMKTPSGMKMVRVTVPIKDFVVDMAKIEDAARRKVKGDMVNFDFVGDIKMEADLTKSQIKKVHKVADELPKDSFRDRYGKKQGDSVRYATATKMVKKKLGIKEDRRLYVETIAGLKKKAEKSGMPYSILKKVYDRGMAAWKGGHRPGATQQQWAFARVNSFVTKSSGTWGGADKDLAAKVRGSK